MGDDTVRYDEPKPSRLALGLFAAAGLALVGAGLVMWGTFGSAVFSDVVLAAIAWCF
jgi:hypothetical protein